MDDKNLKLLSREEYEAWYGKDVSTTCHFCSPQRGLVLKEYIHWFWIINLSPYWGYHTMLIPKRHLLHMSDINELEWSEFRRIYDDVITRYREAHLKHPDGTDIVKYMIVVRARDYVLDHSNDIRRPDHLHVHFMPDKKGMFNPLINKDAHKIPVSEFFVKLVNKTEGYPTI